MLCAKLTFNVVKMNRFLFSLMPIRHNDTHFVEMQFRRNVIVNIWNQVWHRLRHKVCFITLLKVSKIYFQLGEVILG